MSIGNGIKLATGFDLNSKSPLDNRTLFKTIEERDLLPDINLYEGLVCYVLSTQQNYQYINGQWKAQTSGLSEEEKNNIFTEINKKSPIEHKHDDLYEVKGHSYTKAEVDEKIYKISIEGGAVIDLYHAGNEAPVNKDIFWIDKQDNTSNSIKYFDRGTQEWEKIAGSSATSIDVIDIEGNFESSNVEGCLKELSNTLNLKIDDVLLDENNVLTFYSSGNIIKQIELPTSKAKAICGTFLAGELNVGEGLETQRNKLGEPTQWIDNVTPVNAFNLNKIEQKLLVLSELVQSGNNNVFVGELEPDVEYDVWIDTSEVDNVTKNISDDIILEFREIFKSMSQKISILEKKIKEHEARIEYLEQFGGGSGGSGGDNDTDTDTKNEVLTFEDGTVLTFEDGTIMTFEDTKINTSNSTVLTFETNEVLTFEDDYILTFE